MGPDGGDITALATDPAASGIAYAATNGCVWKTTDGGMSWSRACRGLAFPMQIDALVVHPTWSEKLFAAGRAGSTARTTPARAGAS